MDRSSIGKEAEAKAEKYLRAQGLELICRNFSTRTGEIDLIMTDSDVLVFVEVRYRKHTVFGTGAETVTRSKQRRIIRTAESFLKRKGQPWKQFRFDVVSMDKTKLDWIPNAFTLD